MDNKAHVSESPIPLQHDLDQRLLYGVFAALASVLLLWNLQTYPLPWFDEGYFLAVAKTLAQQGLYAVPNSSGPWIMDPSITTGPTVIVPLALVFKLFGVGILQARIVAVAFGVVTLAVYMMLARRLVGAGMVVAALLLLSGTREPYTSFVFLARQLIGEVAALGLWMYGVWLWLYTQERTQQRWWQWACVGVTFGLAVVTKPQMIVGVVPALALTCVLDRVYYRQANWRAFVIPAVALAGCFGAWYIAQAVVAGAAAQQNNNAVLQSGVRSNILGFDWVHIRHALGTLWRTGFWLWGTPSLLYGFWCARRRDGQGLAHAWVLSLVLLWLAWYVVFSIGWPRYAFVPLALTPLWTAGLLLKLFQRAAWRGRLAVALVLLALVLFNSASMLQTIFGPQERSAAQFSAYLASTLPADTVVESWEWNLDSSAPQRFHHPPPLTMYTVIDAMQRDQPAPRDIYDPAAAGATYLVDGPFSSWTGMYQQYISAHCQKVVDIGPYSLYRVTR